MQPPLEPAEDASESAARDEPLIERLREALASALRVAEASLALLRAELRLARSSAFALVWLGFALIVLGASAWLALSVAIAVAIAHVTGNLLLGVCGVAAANLAGVAWVLFAMRRCWRDLSLPRTRALMIRSQRAAPPSGDSASSDTQVVP